MHKILEKEIRMNFEWDENKNKSNLEKHGVDFNQAKEMFNDKDKIKTTDNRKNYGEERKKIVGKAMDLLLSVVFTMQQFV